MRLTLLAVTCWSIGSAALLRGDDAPDPCGVDGTRVVSRAALAGAGGEDAVGKHAVSDSALVALFERAQAFPEFLDGATQRLDEWYAEVAAAQVPDSLVRRAQAVGGRWRLLVVAADTCGDSLRQLPVVARLTERVHGLTMRVITPAEGGTALQARYRSLDGRRATPTWVLIDAEGSARGCVVELPAPLRHLLHARRDEGTRASNPALADTALAWYRQDRGASIAAEVVTMLEAAAGREHCEHGG